MQWSLLVVVESMTGSRIRERRVMQGIKQAVLANDIGISASYLNLIEHNRRRIGGKLLLDIAARLEVEPQALTEGAEAALLGLLGRLRRLQSCLSRTRGAQKPLRDDFQAGQRRLPPVSARSPHWNGQSRL